MAPAQVVPRTQVGWPEMPPCSIDLVLSVGAIPVLNVAWPEGTIAPGKSLMFPVYISADCTGTDPNINRHDINVRNFFMAALHSSNAPNASIRKESFWTRF